MEDTEPGQLEDKPLHRRRGEQRLEAIANNALLRITQFAVTGIALPAIGMGISTMLNRMDRFDQLFQAQQVSAATTELRMLQAEKGVQAAEASERNLRERVLALEYQFRNMNKVPNQ